MKISDAEITSLLLDEQASNPATPGAGLWRLYTKAAGLYLIDDAGAVTGPFGSGGGVSDTVYGAGWNGDTTVAPSKNAVYDKIESLSASYASLAWNPTPIRKTADESVTSSTTLQNDDHLLFAIGASEVWMFDGMLFPIGATAGDIKVTCTVPASATGYFGSSGLWTDGSSMQNRTDPFGTGISHGIDPSTAYPIRVFGSIVNSTNAGNVQIQWAQSASSGTATTLKAGSYIAPRRIA